MSKPIENGNSKGPTARQIARLQKTMNEKYNQAIREQLANL